MSAVNKIPSAVNKALVELRKWAWLILAITAIVSLALFVRSLRLAAAYEAERAAFEEKLQAGEAEIARLLEDKARWIKEANIAYAAAEKAKTEKWAIEDEMARKDKENEALKEKISVMTPSEVVVATRARLGTQEIEETPLGIRFSLAAGRRNLERLTDADYFSLVKEPDYKCLLQKNQQEIDSLRLTIANQGNALVAMEGVTLEHERLKAAYSEILKKSEKQTKWLKFTIGGAGVAVGVAGLYLLFVK